MDNKDTLGLDSINQSSGLKEIPWETPVTGSLTEVPWGTSAAQPGQPNTRPRLRPVDSQTLRDLAAQEGADHLAPVIQAIYGQESGGGATQATSVDGARGGMQVIPATFQRYAKPGERIDNPDDNMRVGVRIIKDLATKFGNDPAKIAAGYFSGEGNVNAGQGSAWKRDAKDGNGKSVSGYVSDVMQRIGGKPEGTSQKPDVNQIPQWDDILKSAEYTSLSAQQKSQAKVAYFDHWIAPHAGRERDAMRQWFLSQKDPAAPNEGAGMVSDAGNLLGIGLNSMTQNVRELVGRVPLVGESIVKGVDAADKYLTGRTSEEILKGNVKDAQARLSPEMQAAGQKKWWDSEKGTFGDAWKDPLSYASGVLQSLPEQFVTMFPAVRLAKGIYASKIAAGVAPEVAAVAAAGAAKIVGRVSEGALGGAASSREVRDKIMAMTPEQLQGSEAMQALMSQGMSFDAARQQIANDSATQAFIASGLVTGAFGGYGDQILAKAFTSGLGKNILTRVGKGVVGEGLLEEFPQEFGSAVAENAALRRADGSVGLTDDALNRAFGGAATGGLQGGTMTAFGRSEAPAAKPTITPDGRLEPGAQATPAEPSPIDVHPTVQTADAIVRELAQQAGIPESTVLPTPAPVETAGPESVPDQDVLDFAGVRLEQLRAKRDGTRETVMGEDGPTDQDVPGVGLSPAEAQELATLEQVQGNPQALRKLYGFDQVGVQSDQSQFATQAQQPAPEVAPVEQPTAGQQFPATTEPGLVAAQENQNAQEQTQAVGPSPSPDPVSADEQPSGPAPVESAAGQANAAQDRTRVPTQGPVTPDLSGWTDDALRAQFRNVQDKTIRAAISAELAKRKAAGEEATPKTASRVKPDEPKLAEGMTRLYHGSAQPGRYDGKAWFSTNREYAANYRGKDSELQYVDVPTERINKLADPDEYGQTPDKGFQFNVEFDSADVGLRKPLLQTKPAPKTETESNQRKKEQQQNGPQATETQQAETQGSETPAAPAVAPENKPKNASKEDLEHLFGIDKKRQSALDRIAKGTAYFATPDKAKDFIKKNGLANTHQVAKNGKRYEIVAKESGAAIKTVEELAAQNGGTKSQAVQDFIEGKRDDAPTVEEVKAEQPWSAAEEKQLVSLIGKTGGISVRKVDDKFVAEVTESNTANKYTRAEGKTSVEAKRALLVALMNPAKQDDFDAMFDEVLAEEVAKDEAAKPKTEKEARAKRETVLYEGKSGLVRDEELFQRSNLDIDKRPISANAIALLGQEYANMFAAADAKEARESFDANGKFIGKYKYRAVITKYRGGVYMFNDLEEAKAFVDTYGQRTTPKQETRKRIGTGDRGQTIFENKQGIRSYRSSGFRYEEEPGKARTDDFKTVEELKSEQASQPKPKTETESRAQRTATESLASAAKNTAAGLDAAIDGLGKLFGGPGRLNSGLSFDEETYAKAKPLFQQAIANLKDAGSDLKEAMRTVVRMVLDKFGAQAAQNMKPYVVRFIEETAGQAQNAQKETPTDAKPVQPESVSKVDSGKPAQDAAAGNRDSEQVGSGVAGSGEPSDRGESIPGRTQESGAEGARDSEQSGEQPSGETRDNSGVRPESKPADDFVIDAGEIGKGGLTKKYRDNVAAIRIIKAMEAEGRIATPDERKQIAKYVGWGAIKGVFDPENKQWAKQHQELKELLTDAEFRAARKSTLDAHYTSPVAVGAMYDAMSRMGFTGGRVLEPSVGVGNFFGLMPTAMRNASQLHGVELDSLTSRLVAALYPKAKIAQATGFEDFQIPSEYFDVVIGNPPFGSQPLVDAERSPYSGFSIHNYFLAKSIDKLRPGGIMQVVVSHNFLDANDGRARAWINERASLIGAVRLPNTAFKENAGTEVVTDILIFQKHDADGFGRGDAGQWQNVVEQVNVNPKTGESVTHKVNQFFASNPQFVLGKPSAGGTMYSADEYTVEATGDIKEQLAEWVKSLPPNIYRPIDRRADSAVVDMAVPDGVKVGSFYVDASGKVMQRGEDVMGDKTANEWTPPNEKAVSRMKGMIALRESLRKQMRLERSLDATESEIEANRAELNKLYDSFLKENEHLNSQVNRRLFMDDTEAQLLQALEFDYDKGVSAKVAESEGIEQRAPSATKADIFKRRVAFPPQDFMTVSTAKDALLASLNYRGKVDTAYMAEVYDKSPDEIVKELGDVVFDDPQAGIVTADEYLSGDVKTKLVEAQAAAKDNDKYKRNVEALEKIIPKDKKPSEISVSIGASFVPAEIYEQFVKHISGGSATAVYVRATGQWVLAFTGSSDPALNTGKYGTSELSAQDLFQLTMLGRGAVVKKTVRNPNGSSTTFVLEKETEAAREKQNTIKAEWQSWLWGDAARADKIAAIYNDKMNRIVERKYDGQHLTFPGMNPAIQLLEHQKNGVWRGLQSFQVLYDHVVGAGKTFEMATLAMEMRRLGIARKPLFVVPNHLTLQWRSEFTRLYPGSNILAATPEDFSAKNRERLFSKIITGDWDAVVIGHSSLKKIGLPEETEKAVLQEQIDEISAAIEQMKRERGDRNIIRDMEGIRARLEAKMKEKLAAIGKRSKVVTFDELGIDAMFVDEMHEFKNLTYNSTMDRNPGMGNPAGSSKAFDMFVKTRWLFDTFGEKTPFITATGTPVSNSLVEMYNMQRYMQYPTLKREGLHVFDAWAKQFGSVENVYEVAPSGSGFRQSTRFAKFTNLPALMGLYNSFADTITLDDLKAQEEAQGKKFPVPKVQGGRPTVVVAKRSPQQAALMGIPKAETDENGNILFELSLGESVRPFVEQDSNGKWHAKAEVRTVAGDINADFGSFETEQEARLKITEKALTPKVGVDPRSILGRFANLRQLTKESKGKINALSLTGEANKLGLDYRLIDPTAPDFAGSKINLAVENMLRIYKQWNSDKGTQLVFCDMSIPLSARSSYATTARRLYVRDESGAVTMKRGTMHTLEGFESMPYFIVQRGEKEAKRFDVYDATSGVLVANGAPTKAAAREDANAMLADQDKRQSWIEKREAVGDIEQGQIDEYNNDNDVETDGFEFFTREDIAGLSGSSKFSVYDDIKAKLVAKGVPEKEIAFIHDYSTPAAKDKLFKAVNSGEIRFLLGSTPKMGAGTNVQKRLVGLHHIDAPWRPSDLEQREGRIIRRGNELYARDPEGFEVFIGRYATEQTYDTRRWQILEHKARGIEQLRNFDGSINEIDDIEGEAANSAEMKAAASGDPLILEETRLRNEVRRLEQLQAGHADEVVSMTRKSRDAQEFADKYGPRQADELKALMATTAKNPLPEDAEIKVTINGKEYTEKESAAKELEKAVGLFRAGLGAPVEIEYRGLSFSFVIPFSTFLQADSPTGRMGNWLPTEMFSASGFLQRLANYVGRLPAALNETNENIEKAKKNAVALAEQAKQPFAQAKDLEKAREDYRKVQRALLAKGPEVPASQKAAVKAGIVEQRARLEKLGYGEALREFFGRDDDAAAEATGPREFNDISISPSFAFAVTPEPVRNNALTKLKGLQAKREDGKITEAEYRLGVQQLIGNLDQRTDIPTEGRGTDWIVAQLRLGVAQKIVPRVEANFAEWLLKQNPNLANDLGIALSGEDGKGRAGNYNPLERIATLFTTSPLGAGTAVHEILHHTERMMPRDVQDGLMKEWKRAWDTAYKAGDDTLKAALDDMLKASLGDKDAHARTKAAFADGLLQYAKHYQLFSPSEFWAVNATDILVGRYAAKGSWVARAVQWFKEFVERAKAVFGLKSDAPILKALDAVMRGDGGFQPGAEMLSSRVDGASDPSNIVYNDIVRNVQNNAIQFFGNRKDSIKTFGAYDKTLATQYHKALKDRDYGRVFNLSLDMQNAVSQVAIRPAELAPAILPRVDDVKSALKTLWKGKKASADLDAATKAIFAGTLAGNNVMEGRVFSEDELRTRFKMTDAGVALYKQARAAIDASLDELAASEAYAMAQGFIAKSFRAPIIENPQNAPDIIEGALSKQIKMLKAAIKAAQAVGNEQQQEQLEASLRGYLDTRRTVEKIFITAKNLKLAGYAPLMRFGKYSVTVQAIDPTTGNLLRDENGESITEFYGQYETEGEAIAVRNQKEAEYKDRDDVRITAGPKSQTAHELYAGISPETLALFADAVGAGEAMKKYYQLALTERSALKRRLERKGIAGFSEDMPRVLSNFITSNARFAAQRYYQRDLNNAIKFIPKEKGDVLDEAIALKKFLNDPNDPAAPVSSALFAWFLGGSVASAVVNLTQPVLMTAPYLAQHGVGRATAAMSKAMPYALGKKQITDPDLRDALKKASQEGIVDAQEIFHLYSLGAQGVASGLTNALAKLPGVGNKIKAGSESARARINAFLTLWGSMFSLAERFNRKLAFIAAWEVAKAKGEKDPFAFAVKAVNETQFIYNKTNRPNWARGPVGRTILTFKQFSISYVELLSRMWKRGGPEGKRAALMMLAMLMLASGEEGLPFSQDLDDLIDTVGQLFGFDTNMRRNKRRLAHEILGKTGGDLFLYGISSQLPLDFAGRLGLGNIIPGSGAFKRSDQELIGRNVAEVLGPAAGMATQIADAYDAYVEGNQKKALQNLSPKAVKDVLAGLEMADKGYATDAKGRKTTDVTQGEAVIKAVGFTPTTVAQLTRKTMPVQQDVALQRRAESSILDEWVRGIADNDQAMIAKAQERMAEWNESNPDSPIVITAQQIQARRRAMSLDKETRLLKAAPKEMRGRVAEGLDTLE